ncbi:MAG: hypothetical protein ACHQIO_09810, partial [Nevskiales bacterium]
NVVIVVSLAILHVSGFCARRTRSGRLGPPIDECPVYSGNFVNMYNKILIVKGHFHAAAFWFGAPARVPFLARPDVLRSRS